MITQFLNWVFGRKPINVTFTASDIRNAKDYYDDQFCLLGTALFRMGERDYKVLGYSVKMHGHEYRMSGQDAHLVHDAYNWDDFGASAAGLRKSMIGLSVTLSPV